MKDFVLADEKGRDIGFLRAHEFMDFQIRAACESENDNTFEIVFSCQDYDADLYRMGCRIYRPGEEEGGIFAKLTSSTADETVRIGGLTWRGMLAKKIIQPPAGQDYMTVSGDVHEVMRKLTDGEFGTLFFVRPSAAGAAVNGYQFGRYVTLLDGITTMLSSVNMRLDISYKPEVQAVELAAVPITNHSDQIEYSQNDYRADVEATDDQTGINHLICLGSGELKDRIVVHLYAWPDGSIRDQPYYKGLDERAEVYDYSSESDDEKLKEAGTERLKERMNQKSVTIDASELDAKIGDRVGGRDYVTGLSVSAIVTGRITTISGKEEKTTCEVKKGEQQ